MQTAPVWTRSRSNRGDSSPARPCRGRQRVLSQGKWSDWIKWDDIQSIEDQMRNLQSAVHNIDCRLRTLKEGSERIEIINRKRSIEEALIKIRKLAGKEKVLREGLSQVFVQIARETLLPTQFSDLMKKARLQYDYLKTEAEADRASLVDEAKADALNESGSSVNRTRAA